MKIRIKDIAKKAEVSIGTVDRVLHNRGEVSEKTREKVFNIIKELNYTPDILARALASKKKYTLSLLLPDASTSGSYWELPKKGIERAFSELNHFDIAVKSYYFDIFDSSSFVRQCEKILDDKAEGVLMAPFFQKEAINFVNTCSKLQIPYVFIDSNLKDANPLSYIGQNAFQSGQVAGHLMSYAIQAQQGQVLVLTIARERDNMIHLNQRKEGFISYFENKYRDLIEVNDVFITDAQEESITKTLSEVINEQVKGIFIPNSRAFRVADFIEKNSLTGIPLIGYDLLQKNIEHLKNGTIDFIISQRPEEQGYRGIITLFNNIIMSKEVEPLQYLRIDILTKENIEFYT